MNAAVLHLLGLPQNKVMSRSLRLDVERFPPYKDFWVKVHCMPEVES